MIVVKKVGEAQFQSGIFLKGGNPCYKTSSISIGSPDIIEYVLGRLLLQLDITAFGS